MFLAFALLMSAEPVIVVTARRETKAALEACLLRHCPVREDAMASIGHAQAEFAAGRYGEARKTLLSALGRNRNATAQDPRALSALWYALARVTLHNGDMQEYRKAALRSGTILAKATSVTPAERQMGELQIGDALAASNDPEGGVRHYRRIAATARANGDTELAELMDLRVIHVRTGLSSRPQARDEFERRSADATLTPRARMVASALAAQLGGKRDGALVDKLSDVPVQPADADPQLLWAPKDRLVEQREAIARARAAGDFTLLAMLQPRSSDMSRYQWADIGFWIRPDGQVEDVAMLRSGGREKWTQDVVAFVQGRRYAPFEAAPGAKGRYKIERVTLTFEHATPSNSLIRRRSGLPSYQFEELKLETVATAD